MKSLLDDLGVKRLTQNIKDWVNNNIQNVKDWAESKFVDVDNKQYYPWEIEYLVRNSKLKPGKQYKIYYNYEKNNSYKYNISFVEFPLPSFILLTAIDENDFNSNAILFDFAAHPYRCIFDYGSNKYTNYSLSSKQFIRINYNGLDYRIIDIYNFNSSDKIIIFSSGSEKIYIKFNQLESAKSGDTIIFFLDEDCTIGAQGIYYYNGLGTITYLKDNKGNEAPFDFINLKIDDKAIITGSNNIIKSFDPENPIFINGYNNFVDYGCKNIEIKGNNNFIGRNVRYVNINYSNCIIGNNYQNYSNRVTYNHLVHLPSYSLEHSETNSYIRRIPLFDGDIVGFHHYHNSNNGGELIFSIDIELRYIFENLFESLNEDNEILSLSYSDLSDHMIHIVDDAWDIDDDFEFISDPDAGAESTIKKVKNKYIAHLCYINTSIINSEVGEDTDAGDASFYIETDVYIPFNGKQTVLCGINVDV